MSEAGDGHHERAVADRKAIAMAAAMPPSRLYRVLDKHGPRDRKAQSTEPAREK